MNNTYQAGSEQGEDYVEWGFTPGDEPVYEVGERLLAPEEIARSLFYGETVLLRRNLPHEPLVAVLDGAEAERDPGTWVGKLHGVVTSPTDLMGRQVRVYACIELMPDEQVTLGCWQLVPETTGGEFIAINV